MRILILEILIFFYKPTKIGNIIILIGLGSLKIHIQFFE